MKRPTAPDRTGIWVLERGDTAILAFAAASSREAKSLTDEEWLLDDLRNARFQGAPLWDGKANLTVRRAGQDEIARYNEVAEPTVDGSGDLVLVYLVELDGP